VTLSSHKIFNIGFTSVLKWLWNFEEGEGSSASLVQAMRLGLIVNWNEYEQYLSKTHHKNSLPYLLNYSRKYWRILENPAEAKDLLMMNNAKRRLVMSSLANLSRYLGVYESWKNTIKEFGLKWDKPNPLSSILSLLNTNLDDVKQWLFNALEKLPKDAATIIAFISLTGLRVIEGSNSISLITKLSEQNKLNKYLDRELMMLQHFRYPEIFLRKSKNAYLSFVTDDFLQLILQYKPTLNHAWDTTKRQGNTLRVHRYPSWKSKQLSIC